MRTTLTLDDDVAAELERRRVARGLSFKQIVNQALRAGLPALDVSPATTAPARTRSMDLGAPRLANLDDTAEVVAWAEGEDHT